MSLRRMARTVPVLAVLAAAVVLPALGTGLLDLRAAENAVRGGDQAAAVRSFESAARKLWWRSDLWERAGTAAYSAGDQESAIRLLQLAREEHSLSAAGWDALGATLWEAGLPTTAVSAWREGTAQHPASPDLWDRLAAAHHEMADFDGERQALLRRLEIQEDPAAHYRLGLLLLLSDPERAVVHLEAAEDLAPEVGPATGTLKSAEREAQRQGDEAARLVVIGRGLGLVQEWGLAERSFALAAASDPTNAEALAWHGEALQHLGQDGRRDLDAALKLGRRSSVVRTLRGLYWRRQGNMLFSLMEYRRAAELEPMSAGLQSLVGEAYAANGDLASALDAYQNAVVLAPQESTYWRLLALFSADNEVQVLDIGIPAGLKAVELTPEDPLALDALGWALAQAGYLSRAETSLLEALDEDPELAQGHLHLGLTYMRWGQNDLALEHWSTARELDGEGPIGQTARRLLDTYFPQP